MSDKKPITDSSLARMAGNIAAGLFETSWNGFDLIAPCHHTGPVVSVVGHGTPTWVREQLGYNPTIYDYRRAMGIDWMNRNELSQAIPPAYTEYVGKQLIQQVSQARSPWS